MIGKLSLGLIILVLTACGGRSDLAPVVDSHWRAAGSGPVAQYVVKRGDTLYSIAFRYDQDYRDLAALNRLPNYQVRVGQVLRIRTPWRSRRPVMRPAPTPKAFPAQYRYSRAGGRWVWPVRGRLVSGFFPGRGKKGLDIAGRKGDRIRAAQAGTVAYAGSGLPGYGNLIIIRHDNQFLTAYGNNARNLVHEGQKVSTGQVIAEMGLVDRKYWGLHFEIRQLGNPVNPMHYLR